MAGLSRFDAAGLDGPSASRQGACTMRMISAIFLCVQLAMAAFAGGAPAQDESAIRLSANLSEGGAPLIAGLRWRLFNARAEGDGSHALIAESTEAQPVLSAPPGDYVVHAAFGLASAVKRFTLAEDSHAERLTLNAGALKIIGTLGDAPIDPTHLSVSIYVPEHNNPEAKLVYSKGRAGDVIGLPEGAYHVVSTYLDTVRAGSVGAAREAGGAPGAATPTNSIVNADIKVPAGKIIDLTLRHRYAKLTLKLVNAPGAEALANTNFTVLTPGGDPIRELIGAFPSLVLAEGEYVAIARHDSKTYQSSFQVQSGLDRDVEVVAKDSAQQGP
jgi:hypothetical protein